LAAKDLRPVLFQETPMMKIRSKSWRRVLAVAVLIGSLSRVATATGKEIDLVENGTSAYAIVIAADAPRPVRTAAEELQRYIREISGAVLPITAAASQPTVISIRLADASERSLAGQGEDAYLMRSEDEKIVLVGNCPRSALYAAYAFLERHLGCAWCVPGDDTVPQRRTIRLRPFDDMTAAPAFSMRQIILYPYNAALLTKNNIPHTDWLTKNRMNWAHPAPNSPYVWERTRSREVFVPEVEKRGLLLEVGGHTFNTWVPKDRYAASHPEYFALLADGTRATDGTHKAGLCLSQPGVLKTVTENMIRWLDENPEVDAVDLWHNDSYTCCGCPNCTGSGLAGQAANAAYTRTYIRFANAVAEEVAKRYPRVLINYLAYAHTLDCPPDAPRLRDNILLGLCLFPRPGQRTMRPIETSPQKLDTRLRQQLALWPKLAKHFYVYEYYTVGQEYKKWSMVSMMCQDIQYFHRLGIRGISSDQWGPGWYPLNMYAFARLTWNPDLSPETIIGDFCRGYYGVASGPMSAYWNLLEEGLRESWQTDKPIDWRDAPRLELVKKALASADSDQVKRRVRETAALHQLAVP
jgi:hypothetical protein